MSQELLKSILGTFIRTVTAGAGTWLVSKGYITESDFSQLVAGIVLLLATIGWGAYQKIQAQKYVQAALNLPAGSSYQDVKDKVDSGNVAPGPWLPIIVIAALAVTVGSQTACFKAKDPTAKPAVYSAQSASALNGVQDTLIVLYNAGVIKDKTIFAKHDRITTGLEVFYARIQSKGYDKKDAINAINQVIADVQALDKDIDLVKDPAAKAKLNQILFTLQFGLNSVKAVIEATKEPDASSVVSTTAKLRSPVQAPWWNDVILIVQNTAIKMLSQSRMNSEQAWADTAEIIANIHEDNQTMLVP